MGVRVRKAVAWLKLLLLDDPDPEPDPPLGADTGKSGVSTRWRNAAAWPPSGKLVRPIPLRISEKIALW